MRKLLFSAAAAALFATVSVANAADVTGTIKTVDTAKASITLDDGKTYQLPATLKPADMKVGAKVKVTFTTANNQNMVSAVSAAQ